MVKHGKLMAKYGKNAANSDKTGQFRVKMTIFTSKFLIEIATNEVKRGKNVENSSKIEYLSMRLFRLVDLVLHLDIITMSITVGGCLFNIVLYGCHFGIGQ